MPRRGHRCQQCKSYLLASANTPHAVASHPGTGIPFHFGTGATTLIHQLPRPLRALRRRYPRMTMQIAVTATEEMRTGLFDRRYDLALITIPCPQASLKITPLYGEELLIVRPSNKAVAAVSRRHFGGGARTRILSLLDAEQHAGYCEKCIYGDCSSASDHYGSRSDAPLVESGFGYSALPESALRRQPRYFHVFSHSGPQDRAPAGSGHSA